MADAYPLAWPEGWPRTSPDAQDDGRNRFKRQVNNGRYTSGEPWTFSAARDALLDEAYRLTGRPAVLSTNFALNSQGQPSPQKGRPADQGVAIYFSWKGKAYAMACDRYRDAEGNMRSLALALEALRTLERHGGGVMMEKAFAGFTALPRPKTCWEILGVPSTATRPEVDRAWRDKIRTAHPDLAGGSEAAAAEINRARDEALGIIDVREA